MSTVLQKNWVGTLLLTALVLVAATFSGFGASVEVTVWTHDFSYFDTKNPESPGGAILDRYAQANPDVNFSVEVMDSQGEKLAVALATGTGPDIFMKGTSHEYVEGGYIAPLPKQISSAIFALGLEPRVRNMIEVDGELYGVPFMTDEYVVTYNKDHFAESGLDADRPPVSWDELRTYARRLTRRGEDGRLQRSGYAVRHTGAVGGVIDKWIAYLWSAGGDTVYPPFEQRGVDIKPGFYNDAGRMAAELFHDLVHVDRVYDLGFGDPRTRFRQQRASMQYSEHRAVTFHSRNSPDLSFGLAVPPSPQGKRPVTVGWQGYSLQVTSYCKHKDVAFDVLRSFLLPENDLHRATRLGAIPFNTRNYGRQEWIKLPGMRDLVPILDYARPMASNFASSKVKEVLGEALVKYWNGDIPLDTALAEANRRAEAVIEELAASRGSGK
jgi:ABC-type glycerol-3-phosphate transport system substrate-binding protein